MIKVIVLAKIKILPSFIRPHVILRNDSVFFVILQNIFFVPQQRKQVWIDMRVNDDTIFIFYYPLIHVLYKAVSFVWIRTFFNFFMFSFCVELLPYVPDYVFC